MIDQHTAVLLDTVRKRGYDVQTNRADEIMIDGRHLTAEQLSRFVDATRGGKSLTVDAFIDKIGRKKYTYPPEQDACPTCGKPKRVRSKLCNDCHQRALTNGDGVPPQVPRSVTGHPLTIAERMFRLEDRLNQLETTLREAVNAIAQLQEAVLQSDDEKPGR